MPYTVDSKGISAKNRRCRRRNFSLGCVEKACLESLAQIAQASAKNKFNYRLQVNSGSWHMAEMCHFM